MITNNNTNKNYLDEYLDEYDELYDNKQEPTDNGSCTYHETNEFSKYDDEDEMEITDRQ